MILDLERLKEYDEVMKESKRKSFLFHDIAMVLLLFIGHEHIFPFYQ
jgi:hypothetical protein